MVGVKYFLLNSLYVYEKTVNIATFEKISATISLVILIALLISYTYGLHNMIMLTGLTVIFFGWAFYFVLKHTLHDL